MVAAIDLLPEELIAIQPEELKNTIILVAILFALLNVIMNIYWKISRFRGARKFWIRHLTRADKNFEFAVSSFNWFILTPIRLHFGLLILTYLIFSAFLFVLFYFEYPVAFPAVLAGTFFVTVLSYYVHKKTKSKISLRFSKVLIKKLRQLIKYSLILRYLSYGIILFALSLMLMTSEALISASIQEEDRVAIAVPVVVALMGAFSAIVSRKSQKIAVEYLRKTINEHYVSKPDVTVFTKAESGKISGKLTDIFDKSVLTLEDESGQKFLIPWKSIDFLAVRSADLTDAKTNAKEDVEDVTESPE
jgi:hypothetical protein